MELKKQWMGLFSVYKRMKDHLQVKKFSMIKNDLYGMSGADWKFAADTKLEKNFSCGACKKHLGQEMR